MSICRPSFVVIIELNVILSFQAAKVKRRNIYIALASERNRPIVF